MEIVKLVKKNWKQGLKFFGIALALAALFFVFFNFSFIAKNFHYYIKIKGRPPQQDSAVTIPEGKYEPNQLSIPSLSVTAPVIYATGTTESSFQESLKDGVVHYPGTAMPGEAGNCYVFGHSSDFVWSKGKYKTVFALLPKIKEGDEIYITDGQSRRFIYKVISTKVVAPDDMSVLEQGENKKTLLTLQTSYPLGTALKRFIAVAELKK